MTTSKNTYTNVTALRAILAGEPVQGELYAKVGAMLAAEEKKATKAKERRAEGGADSKEKIANRNAAIACVRAMVEGGDVPRNSTWLMEHVNGLMTAQAVAGKMNIARAAGWVAYSGEMVDKKRAWVVTDAGREMIANLQ